MRKGMQIFVAALIVAAASACRTEEPEGKALGAERGECAGEIGEPGGAGERDCAEPAQAGGKAVARPPGTSLQPTMSPDHWGATRETPRPQPHVEPDVVIGPPPAPGSGGQDARDPGPERGARGAPPAHPEYEDNRSR